MAADAGAKLALAKREKDDLALSALSAVAEELGIWLLIGSLPIKLTEDKTANRSCLIGPDGRISARYDKIHLFDVNLPDGESYRESNTVSAGEQAVTANLPWGRIGLSVCYDLRFPHLYRSLAKAGAEISASHPLSRKPPAKPIGMCWCVHAQSRMAVSSSPLPRAAGTQMDVPLMAIA